MTVNTPFHSDFNVGSAGCGTNKALEDIGGGCFILTDLENSPKREPKDSV